VIYQTYSGREQLQQKINAIKKWGRDGPTGQRLLTCTWIVCKFDMKDRFSSSFINLWFITLEIKNYFLLNLIGHI
jgi:hypothetical protein